MRSVFSYIIILLLVLPMTFSGKASAGYTCHFNKNTDLPVFVTNHQYIRHEILSQIQSSSKVLCLSMSGRSLDASLAEALVKKSRDNVEIYVLFGGEIDPHIFNLLNSENINIKAISPNNPVYSERWLIRDDAVVMFFTNFPKKKCLEDDGCRSILFDDASSLFSDIYFRSLGTIS